MNDPLALLVMVQETVFFSVAIKVSAKKVGFVSGTENNPRSSSSSQRIGSFLQEFPSSDDVLPNEVTTDDDGGYL